MVERFGTDIQEPIVIPEHMPIGRLGVLVVVDVGLGYLLTTFTVALHMTMSGFEFASDSYELTPASIAL